MIQNIKVCGVAWFGNIIRQPGWFCFILRGCSFCFLCHVLCAVAIIKFLGSLAFIRCSIVQWYFTVNTSFISSESCWEGKKIRWNWIFHWLCLPIRYLYEFIWFLGFFWFGYNAWHFCHKRYVKCKTVTWLTATGIVAECFQLISLIDLIQLNVQNKIHP